MVKQILISWRKKLIWLEIKSDAILTCIFSLPGFTAYTRDSNLVYLFVCLKLKAFFFLDWGPILCQPSNCYEKSSAWPRNNDMYCWSLTSGSNWKPRRHPYQSPHIPTHFVIIISFKATHVSTKCPTAQLIWLRSLSVEDTSQKIMRTCIIQQCILHHTATSYTIQQ